MDYRSLRIKDANIDIAPTSAKISKNQISDAIQTINNSQGGLEVQNKVDTGKGILFVGPYGVVLGEFKYSATDGGFVLELNESAKKQYKEQVKRQKHKKAVRKFVLCRVIPFGLAVIIVVGGIVNVIKGFFKGVTIPTGGTGTEIVNVADANSIKLKDADFAVVLRWMDYAMGQYEDDISGSEYEEYVRPKYDATYENYVIPVYSTYERYMDVCEEAKMFPDIESTKISVSTKRAEFYDLADELNQRLDNKYRFENTIFSKAIVVDVEKDEKHANDVEVYLPLSEIEGTEYSFDNMPEGAFINQGVVYVPLSVLYEKGAKAMN